VNSSQTFTLTATDRNGNTSSLTGDILVRPPPDAARIRSVTAPGTGHVVLSIEGTPNGFYRVDKAVAFGDWTPLGTVSIPLSGQGSFEDPSPNVSSSFYRLVGLQ